MDEKREGKRIGQVTGSLIGMIAAMPDESSRKAILAKLRNSINKPVTENIEVLSLVFSRVPEEFLGRSGDLTKEEDAIFTTLQLYALHQQGMDESVMLKEDGYDSIGIALNRLRNADDSKAADRRFNAMITAATFAELKIHLRHLIKLLKAKEKAVKIDYAALSEDLFRAARDGMETVRLKWARDYYRMNKKGEKTDEK